MKKKKKILVFIDWYLPGYKAGGPIQSCVNLVEHLQDDYEFSVVTRNTDYCETTPYPSVKSDTWNESAGGTRVFYFSKERLNKKSIQQLLEQESFDVLYLNGVFSWFFTLLPLYLARNKNKKIIVAARGMLAPSALAIKKTKKSFFLFISKATGLFSPVIFHATNESEKKDIQAVFKNATVRVAANLPSKQQLQAPAKRNKQVGQLNLVSIARISPEKNLKYALEILRPVKSQISFDVYGPIYNESYWEECRQVIETLPSNIQVQYKGSVESSMISSVLSGYHALLMPTRGENFGHIILQAFSSGCPVIISDQTMWKELEKEKCGYDIPLSSPATFTRAVEELAAMDEPGFGAFSQKAFEYAEKFVSNGEWILQNKKLFGE